MRGCRNGRQFGAQVGGKKLYFCCAQETPYSRRLPAAQLAGSQVLGWKKWKTWKWAGRQVTLERKSRRQLRLPGAPDGKWWLQ